MEIEMTYLALSSIDDILSYVETFFSPSVAERVKQGIKEKIYSLSFMPTIGKALDGRLTGLRCLYYKQNQIIYQIHEDRIQIIIVWDGRQDPDRLLDLILEFFSKR